MQLRHGWVAVLFSVFAVIAASACGKGAVPGDSCPKEGDQICSDNMELVCGGDLKWDLGEDCDVSGTKCVIKGGGDADCE